MAGKLFLCTGRPYLGCAGHGRRRLPRWARPDTQWPTLPEIGLPEMGDEDAKWFSESVLGLATEVTQGASVQRGRFHVRTDRGGQNQSETKRAPDPG